MSRVWAAHGPLAEPRVRSGVHTGGPYRRCECRPTFGESCPACDGVDAERFWRPSDDTRQATPPCMRQGATDRHGGAA